LELICCSNYDKPLPTAAAAGSDHDKIDDNDASSGALAQPGEHTTVALLDFGLAHRDGREESLQFSC